MVLYWPTFSLVFLIHFFISYMQCLVCCTQACGREADWGVKMCCGGERFQEQCTQIFDAALKLIEVILSLFQDALIHPI